MTLPSPFYASFGLGILFNPPLYKRPLTNLFSSLVRMATNRVITIAIITVLVILIFAVIFAKFR